ncbi:MAG: M81 family metallopeptidase [Ruminococcaceae bacterium]|nr:M81 family metallopeptidase [Oscillospiraceae bacterium]
MRIIAGGLEHETNSFSNIAADVETVNRIMKVGEAYIRSCTGVRCMMGGFIDECRELGIQLLAASHVNITPCDATRQDAFEMYRDLFVEQCWTAHCEAPLDAIALNIHGAAIAEGYPDVEAELLRALRARFGREMPIGMVLDLHGNITPEMLELSEVIVGYKEYPHTDTYEAARLVIRLLHEQLTQGTQFHQALVQLPWHLPPACGVTLSGPACDVKNFMAELVKTEPGLRDASFFHGFPYADFEQSGVSVVTVAETKETAERAAHRIAEYAWSRRRDFAVPIYSAEKAMDLAEQAELPVVINESSDNPGGGGPGDGTHLLREMLKRDLPGSAYGFILDPEVVQQAIAAGVGSRIDCLLGGKTDDLHGEPVALKDAYVKTISDGTYINQNPMGYGGRRNMGATVLLQVGNVSIVVGTVRQQTLDDGPFRIVGIDWQEMRILALKSAQHFKGWWTGRAKTIIPCESPGIQSADLTVFDFKHVNTSYFPLGDPEWK